MQEDLKEDKNAARDTEAGQANLSTVRGDISCLNRGLWPKTDTNGPGGTTYFVTKLGLALVVLEMPGHAAPSL